MAEIMLKARTAFDGLLKPVGKSGTAGVRVRERADLSLATVLVRKGQGGALASKVKDSLSLELPTTPARVASGDLAFVATGRGAWLAVREGGGYGLAPELARTLDGLASVSDQTDGFAVLRLAGRNVRDVLAKGAHIDLHSDVFQVGAAAVTDASHIGITLWRLPDEGGDPVFEVGLFRSYAGSFWSWLEASAAEFGLAVE